MLVFERHSFHWHQRPHEATRLLQHSCQTVLQYKPWGKSTNSRSAVQLFLHLEVKHLRTFWQSQWLRFHDSRAGVPSAIPGQGTKISHDPQCSQKQKNFNLIKYYSAIKKTEIMPFAATWMDLESVVLSEVNQTEKKYHMTSLILISGI